MLTVLTSIIFAQDVLNTKEEEDGKAEKRPAQIIAFGLALFDRRGGLI